MLGTLALYYREPRGPSEEDRDTVKLIGNTAALIIQNARMAERLKDLNQSVSLAADAGNLGLFTWDMASDTVTWQNDRPHALFGAAPADGPISAAWREGVLRLACLGSSDNPRMAQGKRISADIPGAAVQAIQDLGATARLARTQAGEGQAAAAARLGVHVQTIGRIEAGEPGVAIGHVLGLLSLYGLAVKVQQSDAAAP